MKLGPASLFAAALAFGIGATQVYASPLADPLPHPVGPITYTGPVELNGKNLNLTVEGTVQEIYSKVKDRTGVILKPVDLHKDDSKHKLRARARASINCHPQGGGAKVKSIREGASYLNGLHGKFRPLPRTCSRVSCSWDSGIFLCNDNDHKVSVPCKLVAEYTRDILDICASPDVVSLRGQEFDSDGWNVVVRESNC
ncbi:hypothetical protein MGYG_04026 [Nannizzia gypsea CBS 118893]|uniref:Secreted protein n=1 Tax=Arthroderma gypseum (strain ATCC MYA-4604 / CBS 118893) TaxID=535722 RepID=E4UUQ6_ARTGP|nr:hypothetical protein MGYG_04026 [Nannizzia gypsea CBS 118893]EFR01023.1 hypothetical protein MGYG_04026 [Nannizzia gypsea CBS 118893]